jgi:hypothetical protein
MLPDAERPASLGFADEVRRCSGTEEQLLMRAIPKGNECDKKTPKRVFAFGLNSTEIAPGSLRIAGLQT